MPVPTHYQGIALVVHHNDIAFTLQDDSKISASRIDRFVIELSPLPDTD